jgi:hypothetical protein
LKTPKKLLATPKLFKLTPPKIATPAVKNGVIEEPMRTPPQTQVWCPKLNHLRYTVNTLPNISNVPLPRAPHPPLPLGIWAQSAHPRRALAFPLSLCPAGPPGLCHSIAHALSLSMCCGPRHVGAYCPQARTSPLTPQPHPSAPSPPIVRPPVPRAR